MSAVEEDEYEEEEIIIFVEIDGLLDREVIRGLDDVTTCTPQFKIIGLDTDTPHMQIGKEIFVGEYREMVGTALFFEEDKSLPKRDETFNAAPDEPLRYCGKTTKHLYMNRIFLNSKNPETNKSIPVPSYLDDNVSSNYLFTDSINEEISKIVEEHIIKDKIRTESVKSVK